MKNNTIQLINEWITKTRKTPVKVFYPTLLAKKLNIPLKEAVSVLDDIASQQKIITKVWEIRCPECFRTISRSDDYSLIFKEQAYCICGNKVEITPDIVFPAYKFKK